MYALWRRMYSSTCLRRLSPPFFLAQIVSIAEGKQRFDTNPGGCPLQEPKCASGTNLHPALRTGVPRASETSPSQDPTAGLYLGSYGGPRGRAVSYERSTPVREHRTERQGKIDAGTTEDPSWGYPRPVLGAIDPYLEPFCGHLSPKVHEIFQK